MKSLHEYENGLRVELDATVVVQEEAVDATAECRFGSTGWYEPYSENLSELYRNYSRRLGRCQSKVYQDRKDGPIQIGWVFQKRDKYEDNGKPYLLETWVTIGLRENDGKIAYRDLKELRKC